MRRYRAVAHALLGSTLLIAPAAAIPKGDANCDAAISAADLPAVARGADAAGCGGLDVDRDGSITDADTDAAIHIIFPPFEEFIAAASDFDGFADWTAVRGFRITNQLGHLDDALAVANGEAPLPYPPGTIVQFVPAEAMVKRGGNFDLDNDNWEYFFLAGGPGQQSIVRRGRDDVFSLVPTLTCFGCHSGARARDFLCETSGLCAPRPGIARTGPASAP